MPLHLKKARAKEVKIEVPFEDEVVTIVYTPRRLNPGVWQEVKDRSSEPEYTYDFVCRVVKEWDVLDDDDKPVALTPKAIKKAEVPGEVLDAIITAIVNDMLPNPKETEGGGSF
jgi:hypothetical protein